MLLNEDQRKAVESTEGYIRVIAGAGSGKTRALSSRYAYLVNELGILPENILCVTFTNKSAAEMRQRIRMLTGDNDTGLITTFHGLCNTILLEDSHAVSYPKSFLVLDNSDIDAMLEIIYEERGLSLQHRTFSQAREMIEVQKLFKVPDYHKYLTGPSAQKIRDRYMNSHDVDDIIFYGYLYHQKKTYGLDYNDLIILTLQIFEENEAIAAKWQERLEYIMIDEFQDIDGLQYRLMKALQKFHGNLFIVGDPDQTIYTWRGANVKYLLDFSQEFPGTKTLVMNQNYRSSPQILDVCNSLIEKNTLRIRKDLYTHNDNGPAVKVFPGKSQQEEGKWIASQIKDLVKKGWSLKDITILYRAHYISRSIEDALNQSSIPYVIYSGTAFYARREIKDALSYLRMLAYHDDLSLARIINTPKRNFGKKRMKALQEMAAGMNTSLFEALKANLDDPLFASSDVKSLVRLIEEIPAENRPVSEVLREVLEKSGYENMLRLQGAQDRLDNLAELKQSVHEYEISCGEETSLSDYLSHAALFSNADLDMQAEKVKLMTIHTAKGLEFDHVFLAGLCEGMFPTRRTKTRTAMEEERRLAFVAMSRARKSLALSFSSGRHFDGTAFFPSRFVLDIDEGLLDFVRPLPQSLIRDAKSCIQAADAVFQLENRAAQFAAGDRILHPAFGEGTILEVFTEKGFYLIRFDKLTTERKITFKARMEKTGKTELSSGMN